MIADCNTELAAQRVERTARLSERTAGQAEETKVELTAICVGRPDPERVEQVLWELMVHRQQRLASEAAAPGAETTGKEAA